MTQRFRVGRPIAAAGALALAACGGPAPQPSPLAETASIVVDGRVALASLVSLGDGHLHQTADILSLLATTDAVRSGEWDRIRGPLSAAARTTVPAVHWFASPDGSYWTVEGGLADANLSNRAYFPDVLAGETVIGALVVSRSSSRNTAIVAVPVWGGAGSIVGVLGSSVHLDSLSARIEREMGTLPEGYVFYAVGAEGLGALHSDPAMIFTVPLELGDAGMRQAFTKMFANEEGVLEYRFRGGSRTVIYRRSPVTRWWYGFGVLGP